MGSFPTPNINPGTFTSGNPQSWFPGAPQYNAGLQQMLQQFNSLDPEYQKILGEFPSISSQLTTYGKGAQTEDVSGANMAATGMSDQLASQFGIPNSSAKAGFGGSGSNVGANVGYGTGQIGTNVTRQEGVAKASQVPGQIAEGQQQLAQEQKAFTQQYQANQIKSLKQMLDLITGAAGSQYGYETAQLGADKGQIALDNAQSAEQQQNLGDILSLISLFSPTGAQVGSTLFGGNYSPGGGGGGMGLSSLFSQFGSGSNLGSTYMNPAAGSMMVSA